MRSAFRDKQFTDSAAQLAVGQTFIAADKIMVPSGPNVLAVLGLAFGAALVAGIGITLSSNPDPAPLWASRAEYSGCD